MKLRFEVNPLLFGGQMEVPWSIVTVELDLSGLSQGETNLLADRLVGIDVVQLRSGSRGVERAFTALTAYDLSLGKAPKPIHILAQSATLEDLMLAIRENERQVQAQQAQQRTLALATANAGLDTVAALGELTARKTATSETELFAFMQKQALDGASLGARPPQA